MWDSRLDEINFVNNMIDFNPGANPVMQHPYLTGPSSVPFVSSEVERMLDNCIIEPAQYECASDLVVAPNRNGSLRFCVDYGKLNSMPFRDTYPLPFIYKCINSLHSATILLPLDSNRGYYQIPIDDAEKDKKTFTSHFGTYRANPMPSGLMKSPTTFQLTLDV